MKLATRISGGLLFFFLLRKGAGGVGVGLLCCTVVYVTGLDCCPIILLCIVLGRHGSAIVSA